MASVSHEQRLEQEFSRQAPTFGHAQTFFGDPGLNGWILEQLSLDQGDCVLDVAGGAGHLARALAPHVHQVVVADATPAMLDVGRAVTRRESVRNLLFVRADAYALPFVDESFDLAVCRFALHHMTDPSRAVAEMARVVRANGQIAVVDMVSGGARHDELERLRDPSHTSALPAGVLEELVASESAELIADSMRDQELPFEPWLRQAATAEPAAATIREALEAELAGGPATGLRAGRDGEGAMTITQRWRCLVGLA